MNISEKEAKRRQHEKELKSFRNKMGQNIVWFDSIGRTKQFDLLFQWKREKSNNKLTKPEKVKVKTSQIDSRRIFKWVEVTKYPPNLKHFINERKNLRIFTPSIVNVRQSTIDLLLNKK
jgi:phage terminase large subunit GpA-like protein